MIVSLLLKFRSKILILTFFHEILVEMNHLILPLIFLDTLKILLETLTTKYHSPLKWRFFSSEVTILNIFFFMLRLLGLVLLTISLFLLFPDCCCCSFAIFLVITPFFRASPKLCIVLNLFFVNFLFFFSNVF